MVKGKKTEIHGAFDRDAHKTERSAVAVLMHWMRETIEKNNLDLGLPDVDTGGGDRKSPDLIIYESRRSQKVVCVIEAKPPYFDVFSETELKKPAWEKANQRRAKYFATTNFRELIWFDTEKVNALRPEEEQILERIHLSEMEDMREIEESPFAIPIKKKLHDFLIELQQAYHGGIIKPKLAIDDLLVYRLYSKIQVLSRYYREIIYVQSHKDPNFLGKIQKWFSDQGWNFTFSPINYDQTARQTAYLLINKILFYHLLQAKRPKDLDPLEIPESLTKGSMLQSTLQNYFKEVLKIDYETIYTTDFIDEIAFPDSKEIVNEIKELVAILKRYDFSKLGYDVIGRIFEKLIPPEERHHLGQYFTSPDVVDLILRFCLKHEEDKILDPACGAGTFLVRAYQHKKMMNQRKPHEQILDSLWGIDIAKFPVHLATINLTINDLSVDHNYPNIIQKDFFDLMIGKAGLDLEGWRKVRTQMLGFKDREVIYPRWFDAIVGNPPYTRHLEIGEISPYEKEYKEKLIQNALYLAGEKIAEISKRAGIHIYFFIHGTKLLKDRGWFGFIVSNSWLDADYGKGLQEFFFQNYKIIAIVESKVEKWFEEAEVNTCIVILQKCRDQKEREKNTVRFVYLKKPLIHFIPPAQDLWEKQLQRLNAIDDLIKTILAHNQLYENDELRIFPKNQKELREEGMDPDHGYLGAKWGIYLRAPSIFFSIMNKARKKLVPLRNLGEINEGKPTGAEEFFFIEKSVAKQFQIEKKYLKPGILKPRGNNYFQFIPKMVTRYFFNVKDDVDDLRRTGALAYIKRGERLKIDKRNTFKNKKEWYKFSARKPADIFLSRGVGDRFYATLNKAKAICSGSFTEIRLKNPKHTEIVWAFLNSPVGWLFLELLGRSGMGGGMLKVDPTDIRQMLVIDPKYHKRSILPRLKNLLARKVGTIEEECQAEDRKALDHYIMEEILGLSREEQEEVRDAVKELVKTRLEKAKSTSNCNSSKNGVIYGKVEGEILEDLKNNNKENSAMQFLGEWYRENVLSLKKKQLRDVELPYTDGEISIEQGLFGWKLIRGKRTLEFDTEEEARYCKVWMDVGLNEVMIPKDPEYLEKILPALEELKAKHDRVIEKWLKGIISPRVRKEILGNVWHRVMTESSAKEPKGNKRDEKAIWN